MYADQDKFQFYLLFQSILMLPMVLGHGETSFASVGNFSIAAIAASRFSYNP